MLTGEAFKPLVVSSGGLLEEKSEEDVNRWKEELGKVEREQLIGGYLFEGCRRWK